MTINNMGLLSDEELLSISAGIGQELRKRTVAKYGQGDPGDETPAPMFTAPSKESIEAVSKALGLDLPVQDRDDRHTFASGAMSSGKKPPYTALTPLCLERFARQREFGDNKYGEDNWKKGAADRAFILDRINHGIEHLLKLGEQIKAGNPGNWTPGEDDAAAVMCNAMFVMEYQQTLRRRSLEDAYDASPRR